MWQRLVNWLALTQTERKVILFLATTLLVGLGLRLVFSGPRNSPSFDYTARDSVFAALSDSLKSDSLWVLEGAQKTQEKVNINTATDLQLESLPGIGPVIAERIISWRERQGPFKNIEELLKIKGITKKRLEQIKNFITIDRLKIISSED